MKIFFELGKSLRENIGRATLHERFSRLNDFNSASYGGLSVDFLGLAEKITGNIFVKPFILSTLALIPFKLKVSMFFSKRLIEINRIHRTKLNQNQIFRIDFHFKYI